MDEYNEESKTMIQVSHFYSKHGLDAHFMPGMLQQIQDDTWIC